MPNIYIKNWVAWAPGITSREEWLRWAKDPRLPQGEININAASIPPMVRRRCSLLSRMIIEVANQAVVDAQIDYAIFGSQHGELCTTIQLLDDICSQTILSPTKFSQSVHNTAAGLFSLLHKLQHNITSIAAGEDTFAMVMTEAATWLQLHPGKTVLLVIADQELPEVYRSLGVDGCSYAVGLVVTHAKRQSQQVPGLTLAPANVSLPQPLQFLAEFITSC